MLKCVQKFECTFSFVFRALIPFAMIIRPFYATTRTGDGFVQLLFPSTFLRQSNYTQEIKAQSTQCSGKLKYRTSENCSLF
jgi:hypothetical protein